MRFTPSSILALAYLAAPALACVDFHADYNWNTGILNAALTDNGEQKCTIINQHYPAIVPNQGTATMGCLGGYDAEIDLWDRWVHYAYGSFSGTFDVQLGDDGVSYTWAARVWGC